MYYRRLGFGKAVRDKLDEIRSSPLPHPKVVAVICLLLPEQENEMRHKGRKS